MKYYIIAGEASGDLHASNLMKSILKEDSNAEFRFWGGDLMSQVSSGIVKHYRDLAFMGFLEVLMNLSTILKNIKFCKKNILEYNPDTIIFIDYPGFNLRIAKWAKANNFKTHYYISPQVWAWKENRVKSIKRDIDYMYVILPFEKHFYEKKYNYSVHFVGHPLLDVIAHRTHINRKVFCENNNLDDKPIIALLPGSRKQEVQKMLKQMLSVVTEFEAFQFVIAQAPSQNSEIYDTFIKGKNIKKVANQTYDLLSVASAALVTSGTATLETALFKVPQVVCYKGSYISYLIAKKVITLKYISLVNLIVDKEIIKELIQNNLNKNNLIKHLNHILDQKHRLLLLSEYDKLHKKLGNIGASDKTAKLIIENISK